jgi:hypothetical protein
MWVSKCLLSLGSCAALAWSVDAGQNGITPGNGNYGVVRATPGPEEQVASAEFESGGQMTLNPSEGSEQSWEQQPDGNYKPVGGGPQAMCIRNGSGEPPYVYDYKLNGGVVSSGYLDP